MLIRIIEFLGYTGSIAAMLATALAIYTFIFLNTGINYMLLVLIFCGTLVIYNIDHLRDVNFDQATNPQRVNFIIHNKSLIYLLTGLSILVSILTIYYLGFNILPILVIPFIFGLLHRRIKSNPLISATYITLSWLIVTVWLPAYVAGKLNDVVLLAIVIGIFLFCNAYTSSLRKKSYAVKHVRYLIYISLLDLLIILVLRGNYTGIIPASLFTTLALTNYMDDENYELIFFDGLQLSGTIISILFLILINI